MPVTLGIPRETFPGERRVALTPRACEALKRTGMTVLVEENAGAAAGFPDKQFLDRGATMATRAEVFAAADIIVQVRTLGANPDAGRADLPLLRAGQLLVGFGEAAHVARSLRRAGSAQRQPVRDGTDAAYHARAEHGRAFVHGDSGGLSGSDPGRGTRFRRCSR